MEEEENVEEKTTHTLKEKREQKIKDQYLDKAYKTAEIKQGLRSSENKPVKKSYEKSFPKLGILLIVLAMVGLIIINNAPWAFIEYDTDYGAIEASIYRDNDEVYSEHQDIMKLFETPYFIGLSTVDFSNTPEIMFYGFIFLIIIGVLITVFGFFDEKMNFSLKIFTFSHLIFAISAIIPCIIIVISAIKFISAHLLLYLNMSQINSLIPNINITFITFPAAFVVIALGFIIIKLEFTVMKIDLNELQKLSQTTVSPSKKPLTNFSFGGAPH
jgi:hypothetical protein